MPTLREIVLPKITPVVQHDPDCIFKAAMEELRATGLNITADYTLRPSWPRPDLIRVVVWCCLFTDLNRLY